jgi:methionine aminotransferase
MDAPRSKLPDVGTTIFTVMSARAAEHGAINLSQGFPDFEVPAALRAGIARHVEAGHNQYAPMAGLAALREQLALKLGRSYARRFDPEREITVVPGATEAIFCAVMASLHPGDEAILFDPSYDSYEPSVRLAGARAIRIPLAPPDFRIDWQRVRESITPRTRLIVINSPHNPTGTMLSAADLDELERVLEHTPALLLSDEVYEHLVFDGAVQQSVLMRPALAARAFAVFSFGKTFHATGWKTGYCVAPPALTAELRRIHQFVTFVAVTPIQHALADFLRDEPGFADTLAHFYQDRRDFFCDLLEGSRWTGTRSAGSYFQLLDYSAIADVPDTGMAERLVTRHGVAAIPVSVFYQDPPPRMRLLRFCFAKQESTLARAAELLCAI